MAMSTPFDFGNTFNINSTNDLGQFALDNQNQWPHKAVGCCTNTVQSLQTVQRPTGRVNTGISGVYVSQFTLLLWSTNECY